MRFGEFLWNVFLVVSLALSGLGFLFVAQWFSEVTPLGVGLDVHGEAIHAMGRRVLNTQVGLAVCIAADRFVFSYISIPDVVFARGKWIDVEGPLRCAVTVGYFLFMASVMTCFGWAD